MNYAELSDEAKEKAREWYRRASEGVDWWDCTYEDAAVCLGYLGFDIKSMVDKRNRAGDKVWVEKINIEFSRFFSQGDGASFTGTWNAAKVNVPGLVSHAPLDKVLHAIAVELSVLALAEPDLIATIKRISTRHSHSSTMDIGDTDYGRDEGEWTLDMQAREDQLVALARRAADWVYQQLEKEYDYQTSDERMVEDIEANEYEFDEEGGIK